MSGELWDISAKVVEDWKEKLPTLGSGYELRAIFNMNETELICKTSTDKVDC